ncbi:E3 ubiquitin-protein ligase DTX3L-like [Conger conger]|uniref:E3 ubiquitin-protein ligase DTX3L-like n=1 Tax=Conger conger TaxID=82655 RepID=UPI002A5A819D|nr:E3 ubiquitin-protein ligase DTX3L-like [Conger conger]
MGTSHTKEKWDCNQYLSGKGPILPEASGSAPSADQASVGRRGGSVKQEEGVVGDQPDGQMKWVSLPRCLPCYPHCGTIEIEYCIADGIQQTQHPKPGRPFTGLRAVAYLPDDAEGAWLLQLLVRAFERRLVFTVATGADGSEAVAWADIPHCSGFSNPDPHYLKTLKQVLKSKGIE